MGKLDQPEVKDSYSAEEVSKIFKLKPEELDEFEKEGVFEYADPVRRFLSKENFERIKTAVSLKRELGVNLAGIDIILGMREKISHLQDEFQDLLKTVKEKLGSELEEDLRKMSEEINKR